MTTLMMALTLAFGVLIGASLMGIACSNRNKQTEDLLKETADFACGICKDKGKKCTICIRRKVRHYLNDYE